MTEVTEAVYVVTTRTPDGRERRAARGGDGHLDIRLATGDGGGSGAGSEQPFAGRGSAGFEEAMGIAALRLKVVPFDDTAIDAEFDLWVVDGAQSLQARLAVRLPGLPPDLARRLADTARRTSLQANAVDGDIDLVIEEV